MEIIFDQFFRIDERRRFKCFKILIEFFPIFQNILDYFELIFRKIKLKILEIDIVFRFLKVQQISDNFCPVFPWKQLRIQLLVDSVDRIFMLRDFRQLILQWLLGIWLYQLFKIRRINCISHRIYHQLSISWCIFDHNAIAPQTQLLQRIVKHLQRRLLFADHDGFLFILQGIQQNSGQGLTFSRSRRTLDQDLGLRF